MSNLEQLKSYIEKFESNSIFNSVRDKNPVSKERLNEIRRELEVDLTKDGFYHDMAADLFHVLDVYEKRVHYNSEEEKYDK